jgi:hypothetical protein
MDSVRTRIFVMCLINAVPFHMDFRIRHFTGVSGIGRQFCSAFNRFLRCCAVSLADRGGGPSTPQPCARLPQSPPRSFVQLKHKILVVPIHISVPSQLGYASEYCRPYPKGSLANLCF